MYTSTLLGLLVLLTPSLCAPRKAFTPSRSTSQAEFDTSIPFVVSNFTEGCSPTGCTYTFNITLAAPRNVTLYSEPSFATYCTGNDVNPSMVACANRNVSSMAVPVEEGVNLTVSHAWSFVQGRYVALVKTTAKTKVSLVDGEDPGTFEMEIDEIEAVE